MIVSCSPETYPAGRQFCGKVFDDLDHSTLCPHEPLPPKRSLGELAQLAQLLPHNAGSSPGRSS